VVNATPRLFCPREWPSIYCIGRWMCPRAGLEGCGISSPKGFDPRTFQPVDSCYTDWVILYISNGKYEHQIAAIFYVCLKIHSFYKQFTSSHSIVKYCFRSAVWSIRFVQRHSCTNHNLPPYAYVIWSAVNIVAPLCIRTLQCTYCSSHFLQLKRIAQNRKWGFR
jgi:hypothetical protein